MRFRVRFSAMDRSLREEDLWLNRLQEAVSARTGFLVLRARWDGALDRRGDPDGVEPSLWFGPQSDAERIPSFSVLLGDTRPETLLAWMRRFRPHSGKVPIRRAVELIDSGGIRTQKALASTSR